MVGRGGESVSVKVTPERWRNLEKRVSISPTTVVFFFFPMRVFYPFPVERKMDNADGGESLDNLEHDTNLVSRAENLRRVLRELRNALRNERLNLHQEIEMTILQKFIERRNYESLSGYSLHSYEITRTPSKLQKLNSDPQK